MAYILIKLNTAVKHTLLYTKDESNSDELIFGCTLKKASQYLSMINDILHKSRDSFGYQTKVASLSHEQWRYFDEIYNLLERIYKALRNKKECENDICLFNKKSQNPKMDLILTLRDILNSLE